MYQNPSVLFGVVRIRTSSDKIYLAAILLTHNFAKTKTTKLYESKNIIQGIADDYLYRAGLSLNLLEGFQ